MTRLKVALAALATVAFAGAAGAQEQNPQQRQIDDIKIERADATQHQEHQAEDFGPMTAENVLNKMYQSNLKEIALGQLAVEKASNARVRAFGERLVQDHQKANEKITEVAKSQNIELKEPMMDDKQAKAGQQQDAQAQPQTRSEQQAGQEQAKAAQEQAKADMKADAHSQEIQKLKSLSGQAFDEQFVALLEQKHEHALENLEQAQKEIEAEEVKQLIADLRPTLQEHKQTADRLQTEFATAQRPNAQRQQNQPQQQQQN